MFNKKYGFGVTASTNASKTFSEGSTPSIRAKIAYLVSILFKGLDVLTTYWALTSTPTIHEKNPIMFFFMKHCGLVPALIGNFLFSWWMLNILYRKCENRKKYLPLYIICGMLFCVVLNNTIVMYVRGVL